jgi:D-alanine-D-alanine ligase
VFSRFNSPTMKTRVAVFFGGRSPEHDVSIVTGLQAMEALDQDRFSSFPVYVATDGKWFIGDALRSRNNYIPRESVIRNLEAVTLDLWPNVEGRGRLLHTKPGGMFSKPKTIEFDVALLAFHGLFGEDGRVQGLFEIANVPYTGMRPLASSVLMDKAVTKRVLAGTAISMLPYSIISRPASGLLPAPEHIEQQLRGLDFPLIVKPMHLGSSIGVARATTLNELRGGLSVIFRLDTDAIIEPFVEHLVEYNVAVRNGNNGIETSAIERPKTEKDLLDFKSKYLSGAPGKSGTKQPGTLSQGLLSLTRELNPKLDADFAARVHDWAKTCFSIVYGTGAPRIDFLCNGETGELWLNEVNPCPGSFGYYLWEAGSQPILFSELLSSLVDEAFTAQRSIQLPPDPTHPDARLFSRT